MSTYGLLLQKSIERCGLTKRIDLEINKLAFTVVKILEQIASTLLFQQLIFYKWRSLRGCVTWAVGRISADHCFTAFATIKCIWGSWIAAIRLATSRYDIRWIQPHFIKLIDYTVDLCLLISKRAFLWTYFLVGATFANDFFYHLENLKVGLQVFSLQK